MDFKTRSGANVDVDNDEEMDVFRRQEEKKADERIRKAVEELQGKGNPR